MNDGLRSALVGLQQHYNFITAQRLCTLRSFDQDRALSFQSHQQRI